MPPRLLVVVVALLGLIVAPVSPGMAKPPANKADTVKVPQNYVPLPKLRLAVQADGSRQYRMLELEAWLAFKTPEQAAKVGSLKALVAEAMKVNFLGYDWEAFSDPVEGVDLAKSIIQECVKKVIKGDDAKVDDILIRSMILR